MDPLIPFSSLVRSCGATPRSLVSSRLRRVSSSFQHDPDGLEGWGCRNRRCDVCLSIKLLLMIQVFWSVVKLFWQICSDLRSWVGGERRCDEIRLFQD